MKKIFFVAIFLAFTVPRIFGAAISDVSEVNGYTQIYELHLPDDGDFDVEAVPYSVDNSNDVITGGITRIAYYFELGNGTTSEWVWVSMDAFSQDLKKIGVPTKSSGAVWQMTVSNMNIESNSSNITTGAGIQTGNLEFWPYNYSTGTTVSGIGGDTSTYDFNDTHSGSGNYGSMQIHNYGAEETLFAYNDWGGHPIFSVDDVGIGNNTILNDHDNRINPDWTFSRNSADFSIKNLEVWVMPVVPEPGSIFLFMISLGVFVIVALRR